MYKWTVHCGTCGMSWRMQFQGPVTSVPALIKHCVHCSSDKVSSVHDEEVDYFELLSKEYALPIDIVRTLYDMWDWREFYRFSGFVDEFKAAAQSGAKA